jgi:hypothetical protein
MKPRMTGGQWVRLYVVVFLVDVFQFAIDFTGVGEFVNEFIDVPIGFLIGYYFSKKGISMMTPARLGALAVTFVGEELTAAALPLWVLDIVFTHLTVIAEDKAKQTAQAATKNKPGESENGGPLNTGKVRLPDKSKNPPLNTGKTRSPIRPKI